MTHHINEEQLTAYVLNELNEKKRNKIKIALQNLPELAQEAEMLKEFCVTVKSHLHEVPLPTLTDYQRRAIKNRLNEEQVKKRFKIRDLFEWKIIAPVLSIGVLALVIYLKVPNQMFEKKEAAGLKPFITETDSFIFTAPAETRITGNIYNQTNIRTNEHSNIRTFEDNPYNRYNTMYLVNNQTMPIPAPSHYNNLDNNLDDYDIIFRNKAKPVTSRNDTYAVPINLNTSSYDTVRQFLNNNQMPPEDIVNIEEMINYFDYNYSSTKDESPFSVVTEISQSPWNTNHKLLYIGFKRKKTEEENDPHSNLYTNPAATAKDVKIRLEFDPAKIKAYRLIGYENRGSKQKDFYSDNEMYAKELSDGHMATILYELIPTISGETLKPNKIMTLKLGYKLPDKDQYHIYIYPVAEKYVQFDQTSDNFRFSAAVAGFGMLLKNSGYNRDMSYRDVIKIANGSKGKDKNGHRTDFIKLVKTARTLGNKN